MDKWLRNPNVVRIVALLVGVLLWFIVHIDERVNDNPISPQVQIETNTIHDVSIKTIGLGGVGGVTARYGAMLVAPIARGKNVRFVLVDGDNFEPGNATRMFFSDCGNKAAVTLAALCSRKLS